MLWQFPNDRFNKRHPAHFDEKVEAELLQVVPQTHKVGTQKQFFLFHGMQSVIHTGRVPVYRVIELASCSLPCLSNKPFKSWRQIRR